MQNNEIFIPLFDFYEISTTGIIRSKVRTEVYYKNVIRKKGGKVMKPRYDKDGYLLISLYKDGRQKSFRVHRLVAEAFIPNPEQKEFVNHKNGNKSDNRVKNLEWATQSENEVHAIKYLGKSQPKGEQSRLSRKIIVTYPDGREELIYGQCEAARKLNLFQTNISAVLLGKISQYKGHKFRYANLPEPSVK